MLLYIKTRQASMLVAIISPKFSVCKSLGWLGTEHPDSCVNLRYSYLLYYSYQPQVSQIAYFLLTKI